MRSRNSLKHKLMVPILAYVCAVVALMVYHGADTARAARENSRIVFENTTAQMCAIVENSITNTSFFAYTLSRNDAVQAVFAAQPAISYANKRQVDEYMSQNGPFLFLNTGLINIVFLDRDYHPFFATYYSGNDASVYGYLKENESLRSVAMQGGICPINKEAGSKHAPTFLYAIDVYNAQLNKEGNQRVGTIVMLCSLEKYRADFDALSGPGGAPLQYEVRDKEGALLASDRMDEEPLFSNTLAVAGAPWQLSSGVAASRYDIGALLSGERLTLFAALLAAMAIPMILFVFHRYLTRPIDHLLLLISRLRPGERLGGGTYDEIDALSNYINAMLDQNEAVGLQLHAKQGELHRLEILRARTELSALQSQINPHFLYNTLECVRSIAQINGIDAIQNIVSAMADLFRYTIKGPEIVSVRDEIEIIREYLTIVSVRFSGRYTSSVRVDEDVLALPMLKMLLQPIVENAVFHGLEKKRYGEVTLIGRREGERLVFIVHDNGGSFHPDTLKQVKQILARGGDPDRQEGVGLVNIHRKIQLFYGEDYGLSIASSPAAGTDVTIALPAMVRNAQE